METKTEIIVSTRLIHHDDAYHYFYGYYDNPAFSADGTLHLCHRVAFCDRLPTESDVAELGVISFKDGVFHPIATTTAWNFQQGSMLQWNPKAPNEEIIYNVRGKDGVYRSVIQQIHTGAKRELDRPLANVSLSGELGLSISFERMYDFRPGYGYAGRPDPWYGHPHPAEDGIYVVNLSSGESILVLSLARIAEQLGDLFHKDDKLLINHITFNTDGTRFVALVRNFRQGTRPWKTITITANTDGSEMYILSDYGMSSHYHWRDRDHIVFWNGGPEGQQLYLMKDRSNEMVTVDKSFFPKDGHCSYPPSTVKAALFERDPDWLLYDSYPDENNYRHLYVYHVPTRKGTTLGSYFSPPNINRAAGDSGTDIRCDLHPRWNPDGTTITFDSMHEGKRHVYWMDLREVMARRSN